ncbi:hypothetical protein TELCIR_02888 [Teladorsagia circumcincta]|uniref:Uncharacterized protein n=1 Tax=Teladorsagia circumcincta TaxID=45464 RepID=A0A2G9UXV9_TELCI|nr:hypothetical protein TELCIR_02888 [Teladorsagia circumcincta]
MRCQRKRKFTLTMENYLVMKKKAQEYVRVLTERKVQLGRLFDMMAYSSMVCWLAICSILSTDGQNGETAKKSAVEDKWIQRKGTKNMYRIHYIEGSSNPNEGEKLCETYKSHLASIHSKEENTFVHDRVHGVEEDSETSCIVSCMNTGWTQCWVVTQFTANSTRSGLATTQLLSAMFLEAVETATCLG